VAQLKQRTFELDADLQRALSECSEVVAIQCRPFVSAADARAFVDRWVQSVPAGDGGIERRWDIRATEAEEKAAEAARSLYGAAAIPDPTLSVGYLHDRLITGGNQMNTFAVGVSIPLSFFDRGQGQEQAAANMAKRLQLRRQRAMEAAVESVRALRAAQAAEQKRLSLLETDVVPRAAKVWTAATKNGSELAFAERMLTDATRAHAEALQRVFDVSLALLSSLPDDAR
jgi:outer membrane protein TolC